MTHGHDTILGNYQPNIKSDSLCLDELLDRHKPLSVQTGYIRQDAADRITNKTPQIRHTTVTQLVTVLIANSESRCADSEASVSR